MMAKMRYILIMNNEFNVCFKTSNACFLDQNTKSRKKKYKFLYRYHSLDDFGIICYCTEASFKSLNKTLAHLPQKPIMKILMKKL